MQKRKILEKKIKENTANIAKLYLINREIRHQLHLLCDEKQWYKEATEIRGKGAKKQEVIVGRIYWPQNFKDDSTGKFIVVNRSLIVKVDGKWVD